MNICGLQTLTLLDYPGNVACTVFLAGCNFRCPYCHNAEIAYGIPQAHMSSHNFLEWLSDKKGKLDGVAISGGEPLLHNQLRTFIKKIKDMDFKVKLDTNGYNPTKLNQMIFEGKVDYVAMDIKNSPDKYDMTAGAEVDFTRIDHSIKILMNSPVDYEFRTTVTKSMHDESDFEIIGKLIKGAKAYYLQYCTSDRPDDADMFRYKEIMQRYVKHVDIRG